MLYVIIYLHIFIGSFNCGAVVSPARGYTEYHDEYRENCVCAHTRCCFFFFYTCSERMHRICLFLRQNCCFHRNADLFFCKAAPCGCWAWWLCVGGVRACIWVCMGLSLFMGMVECLWSFRQALWRSMWYNITFACVYDILRLPHTHTRSFVPYVPPSWHDRLPGLLRSSNAAPCYAEQ